MPDLTRIAALIQERRGTCVDFGTAARAPSLEWIQKAEKRLGKPLPPSYKWFLSQYGGGEIKGEEVFSIYGMEFETVFGGDIVFQYLAHQRAGTLAADEVPLGQTDQGEVFFMKTSIADSEGEYPVYVKRGSRKEAYAANFGAFLEKRVVEQCG